ncbi:MAG: NAD(P)/FAD-dependent oxidoreductase, partial [Desulfovibrio sp.]|nr:NAD(P)/FAD-dependent oxidoreductase [Desulfovibrio sp.]
MSKFDVVIIGGGPGGTKAARVLADGGASVAIVESAHWGGVCLNCGCIPTKMLLGATAPQGLLRGLERQRVAKGSIEVDYDALQKRIQRFTRGSAQALTKGLEQAGVVLFNGHARCVGAHTVEVLDSDGSVTATLEARRIVLATGSRSAAFPGISPDHDCVLDSTDMLAIPAVPASLLVVGAGAIGLEMADFFNAMGCKVTVVEAAPQIAPTEDADIAAELQKLLGKSGITCITGVKATSLVTRGGQAVLTLEDGRELLAEKALVAVGRTPNTGDLNAQSADCQLNPRGFVSVNEYLMASPTVYAIGDVNGQTLLAHAAEHQGAYVARHILDEEQTPYDSGPVPSCVYGSLEVMRVGITARQALAENGEVAVSSAQLMTNAIAQAGGDASGFVKVVWHNGNIAGIAALGH